MRLVVTGGAGFIGSNFVRWVLRTQPDVAVTTFDALTYAGNLASLADVADDPRHTFVQGDVRDAAAVARAVDGADAVVHFAAESHVDRSIDAPDAFLSTNVTGAGLVFEACRRAGVERVLHVSTDEVYGPITTGAFAEADRLQPSSPYAASKAGADLLAQAYTTTYDFPILVTRTTNNFGAYQHPEKLIPRFVTNLLNGEDLPVYGDGAQIRDWTAVDDNVRAHWLVLTEGEPGTVYNIGAGNERTSLDIAHAIVAALDADPDRITHVTDRPGHDRRYAVDTARIRALGWRPERTFDDALADTIAWYRDNEAWWRPLRDVSG
ncbi:MAG: dTDP-glucose 4,6-dehydratase [Nitriliruptoraceae bacterium]